MTERHSLRVPSPHAHRPARRRAIHAASAALLLGVAASGAVGARGAGAAEAGGAGAGSAGAGIAGTGNSGSTTAGPVATGTAPITAAERLLFMQPHLRDLPAGARLDYAYVRDGTLEPAYRGTAVVRIVAPAAGAAAAGRTAQVDFLDGAQRLELPPVDDVSGNPVILYFLERELREMNRLTHGSPSYYRKRIRMALAAGPAVDEVDMPFAGRTVRASHVRIDPYRDDPAGDRFAAFTDRHYEFWLSREVPGQVLRLAAVLPARDAGAARLVDTLEFVRQETP